MKKILLILCAAIFAFMADAQAENLKADTKIAINDDASFIYNFVERPKVGDVILKVQLNNQTADDIKVYTEYDMPSMRGHHASGKVAFKRNRAGDYVLPIHFAMPGDWEIKLYFEQNEKEIYSGVINLDI